MEFFLGALVGFRARSFISAGLRANLALLFLLTLDQLLLDRLDIEPTDGTYDYWLRSCLLLLVGAGVAQMVGAVLRAWVAIPAANEPVQQLSKGEARPTDRAADA